MIYESHEWKDKLLNLYKDFNNEFNYKTDDFQKAGFVAEYFIMMSAYIIRKLFDSKKLSTNFSDTTIMTNKYINKKRVTILNNHKVIDLYDMNNGEHTNINIMDLCNQIVHSYVFQFFEDENNDKFSFLVISDYDKNSHLYEIEIETWKKIVLKCCEDGVYSIRMQFNEDIQDYVIKKALKKKEK